MKLNLQFLVGVLSLASLGTAFGQGTFQNLDFEAANVSGYSPGGIPITNALPRWIGYIGGNQTDTVVYNSVGIGGPVISLHDQASSFQPVQGNYSAMLQPSFVVQTPVALGQTGQVPLSAVSMIFYGTPSMQVTFEGQPISLVTLGGTPEYFIRGGDISQFAGQTGELRFTQAAGPLGSVMAWLDNIQFSNQPIPEPSTLCLLALGALLVGWRLCGNRPK